MAGATTATKDLSLVVNGQPTSVARGNACGPDLGTRLRRRQDRDRPQRRVRAPDQPAMPRGSRLSDKIEIVSPRQGG